MVSSSVLSLLLTHFNNNLATRPAPFPILHLWRAVQYDETAGKPSRQNKFLASPSSFPQVLILCIIRLLLARCRDIGREVERRITGTSTATSCSSCFAGDASRTKTPCFVPSSHCAVLVPEHQTCVCGRRARIPNCSSTLHMLLAWPLLRSNSSSRITLWTCTDWGGSCSMVFVRLQSHLSWIWGFSNLDAPFSSAYPGLGTAKEWNAVWSLDTGPRSMIDNACLFICI